jgi:hypothetical protein
MYLSVALSMSSKGCRGITKPIVPAALVKKIIVNNLVTHSRWGFSLNWGWRGIN